MSAAEKLRALDEAMTRAEKSWLATIDEIELSEKSISDLAAALPQIVAVVEAAEVHARANPAKHDPPCGLGSCSFHSTLAALDEALA